MIRRVFAGLATVLAVATSIVAGSASPAAAFGGETFGCRVSPGTDFVWRSVCHNTKYATKYNAGFAVLNTSGSGYTYQWTITGNYQSIYVGCTSTSYDCAVWMSGNVEGEVDVTVTYTQNGQSATQSASAYIIPEPYCGSYYC
jgi:regulation of enolase protein 1 (concanavalin A-like superfamily)